MTETTQTIGELLKERRQQSKIKITEVSSYFKVRSSDISAIENDEISKISKHIYISGFIRSYAKFLQIDHSTIESAIKSSSQKTKNNNNKNQFVNFNDEEKLSPDKNIFLNFLLISILLFLLSLVAYNFYQDNSFLINKETIIERMDNTNNQYER